MLSPCSCFVVLCVSGGRFVTSGLYEAANVLLSRTTRFCALQAWALAVARRRGAKRAKVALARKLGTVLHRMWVDGTEFRWSKETLVAV